MAQIVGGIATSHIPSIGKAIARGLYDDPYWKDFFAGYQPAHAWLDRMKPDVAVVIYNDHGLNFFLDKMPTFAIGAAREYRNADEGWGLPVAAPFPGDPELSWHMIESLTADEFDMTTCQEMLVDHALPCRWRSFGLAETVVLCVPFLFPSTPFKFLLQLQRAASSSDRQLGARWNLFRRINGLSSSEQVVFRTSWTVRGPASSIKSSTGCASTKSSRIRNSSRPCPLRILSANPARKVWSCSCGSSCAARCVASRRSIPVITFLFQILQLQ